MKTEKTTTFWSNLTPIIASGLFSYLINKTVTTQENNSGFNIEEIQETLYQLALREINKDIYAGQADANTLPENLVFKTVAQHIHKRHPDLHQKICIDFKYCEKKKEWKNEMGVSGAALAFALAFTEMVATAGIGTILWLMSKGFFDELCDC